MEENTEINQLEAADPELSDVIPYSKGDLKTVKTTFQKIKQLIGGSDGRGVVSIAINGSNHLIITYTDATTEDAGLLPSGGGGSFFIQITREALRDLYVGGSLVHGAQYIITDLDEQLIVTATINNLNVLAKSNTFPNDIIHYDTTDTDFNNWKIIYREDVARKLSAFYDWRTVIFSTANGDFYTFGNNISTNNNTYVQAVNGNGGNCFNIHLGRGTAYTIFGDDCYNISIGHQSINNIISNFSANNVIGNVFQNCNIGEGMEGNVIGTSFRNNLIGTGFFNNEIGNSFDGNTIGDGFYNNKIGSSASLNSVGNGFQFNVIGNYWSQNTIGNGFYNNIFGQDFVACSFGNNINNNVIGNLFQQNTIGNNFYQNNFKNGFINNIVGDDFNFVISEFTVSGLDFTAATFVKNGAGQKWLESSLGSVLKLRYFDGTQYQWVNPTS